ncbi:MAG: non-heme chloroperoxidase [Acidimicrobiaceae bacterium]|nr:non-heme chloroperoxidase [Acidimicrobiaceae bacterium]
MTAAVDARLPVTGGVHLAVRSSNPDGPEVPVLLVHGLASNARTWDDVADRLVELGHPVAAVDQRGHGRSDKPDTGYDFATVTADLAAVIGGLGWSDDRRPLVAGQSWGGNVVLELAVRHPAATRAIACVDGGTLEVARRFPTWEQCLAAMTPPRLAGLSARELETMVRTWHPDWSPAGVAGTLANMEVLPDGTISPWLSLDHHLAVVRQLWEHHPPERWPLVGVPVLLIPSVLADDFGIAAAEAALAPGRLRVAGFPGADHDVHIQHPVEVADLLHAFCRERLSE